MTVTEYLETHQVILASGSPRRREILAQAGFTFQIIKSVGEEQIRFENPSEVVMDLSAQKAKEVYASILSGTNELDADAPCLVIGADTVVALDGIILGKPKDEADAFRMLKMLQGRAHEVYTGVTLIDQTAGENMQQSFFVETKVYFKPLTDAQILTYIATGEPMDKAGSYGIQGVFREHIEKIEGDYLNVVGFPLDAFLEKLHINK